MKISVQALLCGALVSVGAANATSKHFAVFIPSDYPEWLSDIAMISFDGGKTGEKMQSDPTHCGWVHADIDTTKLTDSVVIFRKGDINRVNAIGINGNWETSLTATPIFLKTFYEAYGSDTLYFVADEEQLPDDHKDGWFDSFPDSIIGICQYDWQMVVYDTDAKLHPAFSCYASGGEGCQFGIEGVEQAVAQKAINACNGVITGIVADTLDTSVNQFKRKPKLTQKGESCFISEKYFNQLFNITEGVNEASCATIPITLEQNSQWAFNSDFYTSKGAKVPGGFYPVESTTDDDIKAFGQTPLAEARVKRVAEGPIFYGSDLRQLDESTGYPKINLVCNGAGWNGGVDCEGSFTDRENTETLISSLYPTASCILGWSCKAQAPEGWNFFESNSETIATAKTGVSQWTGERNQHFCTESHMAFEYQEGQSFSVLGDDDIWVFIDNKLAIDLGGTHLAAPGFVDLDKFEGLSGSLIEGNIYNLDMFTCDRRTTMSNLSIRTNIYVPQRFSSSISVHQVSDATGTITYTYSDTCYSSTSNCRNTIAGEDTAICETPNVRTIHYILYGLDEPKMLEGGTVNYGGIDLTDISSPKVATSKMELPAGDYALYVMFDDKLKKIQNFSVGGDDAISTTQIVATHTKVYSEGSSISITAQGPVKNYAIMDMMGRVLKSGNLQNGHASVPMEHKGSYLVRVHNETQRVNLK